MEEWRNIQKKNLKSWQATVQFLQIEINKISTLLPSSHFPLNLPLRLAEKIEKNNLEDPILKQFLPMHEEAEFSPSFVLDPVADASFCKTSKLLHKYQGRALLLASSACAMHCRYCFRQNFDYETTEKSFELEIYTLSKDTSLTEIILSGGDPLSLSDFSLKKLLQKLDHISHLKKLRFHTRFPLGIPERITPELLSLLSSLRMQTIFIIHSNHPKELDPDVLEALKKIQKLGVPVLCQTVLLKGVNDSVIILKELFEKLTDHGILPYYLHQLDKVQGAAHFEVSVDEGKQLIESLRSQLPGYAVPRYVQEIPGGLNKMLLHPL